MSSDRIMTAGIPLSQPVKRRHALMMRVAPSDASTPSESDKKIKLASPPVQKASPIRYSWPDVSSVNQVTSVQPAPITVSQSTASVPLLVIPPISQASKFLFLNKKPVVSGSSSINDQDQIGQTEKDIFNRFLTLVFEEDTTGSVAKSIATQFSNFFMNPVNLNGSGLEDKEIDVHMQIKSLTAPLNKCLVEIAKFHVSACIAKRMLFKHLAQLLVDLKADQPERYFEILTTILKDLSLPKNASFHLVLTMMEYDHLLGAPLLLPAQTDDVLRENFAMLKLNFIKKYSAKTYNEITEHYADNLLQLLRSAGNYQDEGRNGKRNGAFLRVPDRMLEIGEEIFQYLISPANKKTTEDCKRLFILANHYIERALEFNKAFKKECPLVAKFRPLNIYLRLVSIDSDGREHYASSMKAYIEKAQLEALAQAQNMAMSQRALLAVAQAIIKADSASQTPSLSFSR